MAVVPKIAVIVLNWNGRDDTLECVTSVSKIDYANFEVVVVDNGSTDGSVQALRESFPNVTVLETRKNLGYAGGNNVGIDEALRREAEFVFLLNNDAVVDSAILKAFIEAAGAFPDAGVFGAKIYYQAEPRRLWYAGARWCDESGSFEHVGINDLDGAIDYAQAKDTDHACGCAMFISSAALRDVGLLEPKFFLTFEEADWCYRGRKKGYRCIFVPSAKVWHKVSVSFGGENSPLFRYFYTRNRLLWAERHLNLKARLPVWKRTLLEIVPPWDSRPAAHSAVKQRYWELVTWVKLLRRQWSLSSNRAMRRAVRDYLMRSFGDCPAAVRRLNPTAHP